MKNILALISLALAILIGSCQSSQTASSSHKDTKTVAATKQILSIPAGPISKEQLESEPHKNWFNQGQAEYTTDKKVVSQLAPLLSQTDIVVFMGTWCSDSRREVPAFYAILNEAGVAPSSLKIIAVDTKKRTPEGLEKGRHIERVPTFIFMKKGQEIGRIVEIPVQTLEKDMLTILSGQPYKHAYKK